LTHWDAENHENSCDQKGGAKTGYLRIGVSKEFYEYPQRDYGKKTLKHIRKGKKKKKKMEENKRPRGQQRRQKYGMQPAMGGAWKTITNGKTNPHRGRGLDGQRD